MTFTSSGTVTYHTMFDIDLTKYSVDETNPDAARRWCENNRSIIKEEELESDIDSYENWDCLSLTAAPNCSDGKPNWDEEFRII